MQGSIRRPLVASAVFFALVGLLAGPAVAQVGPDGERLYTGVNPPAQGSVLAPTVSGPGTALGVVATPTAGQGQVLGVQGQVLPLQVSSGAVAGASRAPARGLALTGADVATLVLIGFAAVALGAVLTRRGRPRSAPTS